MIKPSLKGRAQSEQSFSLYCGAGTRLKVEQLPVRAEQSRGDRRRRGVLNETLPPEGFRDAPRFRRADTDSAIVCCFTSAHVRKPQKNRTNTDRQRGLRGGRLASALTPGHLPGRGLLKCVEFQIGVLE